MSALLVKQIRFQSLLACIDSNDMIEWINENEYALSEDGEELYSTFAKIIDLSRDQFAKSLCSEIGSSDFRVGIFKTFNVRSLQNLEQVEQDLDFLIAEFESSQTMKLHLSDSSSYMPGPIVRHIASYLEQNDYFHFEQTNRAIFIDCNSPNILKKLCFKNRKFEITNIDEIEQRIADNKLKLTGRGGLEKMKAEVILNFAKYVKIDLTKYDYLDTICFVAFKLRALILPRKFNANKNMAIEFENHQKFYLFPENIRKFINTCGDEQKQWVVRLKLLTDPFGCFDLTSENIITLQPKKLNEIMNVLKKNKNLKGIVLRPYDANGKRLLSEKDLRIAFLRILWNPCIEYFEIDVSHTDIAIILNTMYVALSQDKKMKRNRLRIRINPTGRVKITFKEIERRLSTIYIFPRNYSIIPNFSVVMICSRGS